MPNWLPSYWFFLLACCRILLRPDAPKAKQAFRSIPPLNISLQASRTRRSASRKARARRICAIATTTARRAVIRRLPPLTTALVAIPWWPGLSSPRSQGGTGLRRHITTGTDDGRPANFTREFCAPTNRCAPLLCAFPFPGFPAGHILTPNRQEVAPRNKAYPRERIQMNPQRRQYLGDSASRGKLADRYCICPIAQLRPPLL
jgi:hypothetical protein